jgi:hypothetical protein
MKKFLPAIAVLALSVSSASAATLVWSASLTTNGFDTIDGTDLAPGSLIRAGFFDLSDTDITNNSNSLAGLAFLNQHFTEFAVAHIGEGVGNIAGHFTNNDNLLGPTAATLAGSQIYLWAFSSSDNSTDALSLSTATQTGIFYLPFASNSQWRFPLDPEFGSTTIGMRNLTDAATNTTLLPAAKILYGSFGGATHVSDASGKPNFALGVVPEPSSALLLGAGALGLITRRRRNS